MKTIEPHVRKVLGELDVEIKIRQDELGQLLGARRTICELHELPAELPIGKADQRDAGPNNEKPAKRARKATAAEVELVEKKAQIPPPGTERGRKAKGGAAAAPVRSTAAIMADKPDTVSGAMKLVARELKTFTVSELLAKVGEDADFKSLLEAGNPTSPYSSVAYWVSTGKLKMEGEGKTAVYTVVDL